MGGAVSSIGNAVSSVVSNPTRVLEGVATGGLSEFAQGNKAFGMDVVRNAISPNGSGGNPNTGIPQTSPLQTLVQSGGAPLLANVALGADPKSAVASYFGYSDYNTMYNSLSDEDKQAVAGVTGQLTQIQSNTDLRNQAVDKIINDFPNIAQQALQRQKAAYTSVASDFDAADKLSLDRASDQLAAKYAATGGFSSGAFNAGLARTAADTANLRASNVFQNDTNLANEDYQNQLTAANLRYVETSALQAFQQKMLGQTTQNGFSAAQTALNNNANAASGNAGYQQKLDMYGRSQNDALFGSIGKLAGTVGGFAIGGPLGAAVGNTFGSGGFTMPSRSPSTGGGYRATLMSDNGANV